MNSASQVQFVEVEGRITLNKPCQRDLDWPHHVETSFYHGYSLRRPRIRTADRHLQWTTILNPHSHNNCERHVSGKPGRFEINGVHLATSWMRHGTGGMEDQYFTQKPRGSRGEGIWWLLVQKTVLILMLILVFILSLIFVPSFCHPGGWETLEKGRGNWDSGM